jgi:putative copper resistance protein D
MLYSENCVTCHGPQGKGNGILSRTLSTLPIDMLTEPHTEEHRAGDFYHWLTYGIEGTEMPGYPEIFTEADRWDLVNFIHALSRGYQARILSPEIVPNKPYVMPPNFFYATDNGTSGVLHDFRGEKSVILVVFSWPQSQDRIEQLSQMYDKLRDQDAIILAVPMEELDVEAKEQIKAKIPFLLVTQGSSEIASSYALSRRTLSRPDLLGAGETLDHMEFLIDRYGYLRARWIPESDKTGWRDVELLTHQINQLNQEKQILSLPNDFVY